MTTEEAIEYLTRCADGFDPDFECAVSMAVSALRAQQNGGWISVKDRWPKENDAFSEFIVMVKDAKRPTILQYEGRGWWWDEGWDEDGNHYNVTHWQPLPEPPKGE